MKALLTLLLFVLVSRSYGGPIEDDVDQYDALVVSANTHYKDGTIDVRNSKSAEARFEYADGKRDVESAKRQEKDIREYLKAHPEDPEFSAIQTHVDERSKELMEIDANLEVLGKHLPKKGQGHLTVRGGDTVSSTSSKKPPLKNSKKESDKPTLPR